MSHLTYDDYVNAQSETDAWQQVLDFMSVIVAGCNDVRRADRAC